MCTGIKNIDIPESVIEIGYNVFDYCSVLEKITIHGKAKFGGDLFKECGALKKIYM